MSEDLIAWKWAESLSTDEKKAVLSGSIKRLQDAVATAITAARAETWKEAIAIVKYADAQANWPLKEGSLIKALEAAAGSKTKVFRQRR